MSDPWSKETNDKVIERLTEQLLGVDSVHLEAKIKRLQAKVEALEGVVNGDKYDDPYAMWERACKYKTAAAEQENKCAFCGSSEYPHICEGALNALQAATEQGDE